MGTIKYIDYNSRSILYLDFEGSASDEDFLELSDKAKRLVKLGSRNKIVLLYNLSKVTFTRKILLGLGALMAHAPQVERQVMFGLNPKYQPLVEKMVALLKLERNTRFCGDYTEAVNTLTESAAWQPDRRRTSVPVNQDQRQPTRPYKEEDFLDLGIGEGRLIDLSDKGPKKDQ